MVTGTQTKTCILIKKSKENSILFTQNLSIGYGKKSSQHVVASDININLKKGDLTAVIGINGAGKSTLLRTLSGVQPALGGDVFIQGQNRNDIAGRELAGLISLVLTEQPISRNLKVEELIALGRQPYTNWIGSLSQEDKTHIKNALQTVNLEAIQHKKCSELSDGQLQKVLIGRALAQNTPMVILDEPTSHLDLYHKAQVLQLLRKLSCDTGKAILFASHEINLALQLCDQIILIREAGVKQGTPEELIAAQAFDDLFPSDLITFDTNSNSFKIRT